jgi:Phage portal protein, SPP1 Gp6-like.
VLEHKVQQNFAISYLNNRDADKIRHYYKRVPITMFVNNVEEQSDSRCVYKIIDGYNSLQNNAIKNISTIINSILFIKNMRVGNKEEQSDMFAMLKEQNMLVAETAEDGGNAKKDVDAKFLNNPLNQDQVKILTSSLEDSIHQISGVPNFSSETFAQNSSGTALQLKLLGFINLGYNKQKYFTPSLLRVLKLTLNYLEYIKVDKYNVDLDNIYVNYTMNIPSNDIDITTQIINLKNAGMLNPEVLLSKLSYVKDVDSYIKGIETPVEEKDINIDKSIDKSNNLTNNNINGEHNGDHNLAYTPLQKPNERVQMDKSKRDNLKNYSKSL